MRRRRDDFPAEGAAGPEAEQALRQRTELQRWRGVSGPAPGEPAANVVAGRPLPSQGVQADPRETVRNWLADREESFELLRDRGFVQGVVNIPDPRGEVLQQPQGRD